MEPQNISIEEGRIKSATHLAAIEIGLGSLLHGMKVPFGGNFLSLNQGLFFSQFLNSQKTSSRLEKAQAIFEISVVVACLKSFSPAGQKLGPMLSISMQGALYALGILIFGSKKLGQCLAMGFLSLWAFIQPAFTFIFIFGFDLERIFKLIDPNLAKDVILFLIGFKVLIGMILVFWTDKIFNLIKIKSLNSPIKKDKTENSKPKSPFFLAFRDLLKPLFLISYLIVLVSLYLTESSWSQIFWMSLRPLGLAFLLFYLVRAPWFVNFINHFSNQFEWTKKMRNLAEKTLNKIS